MIVACFDGMYKSHSVDDGLYNKYSSYRTENEMETSLQLNRGTYAPPKRSGFKPELETGGPKLPGDVCQPK